MPSNVANSANQMHGFLPQTHKKKMNRWKGRKIKLKKN